MTPWNMRFALFLVDPRSTEVLRAGLDEVFGGRFEKDLEYEAAGRLRYLNRVFGLLLSCGREASWPEGTVYRFTGGNDDWSQFDTTEELDVGFHVRQLLAPLKLHRVLTLDEFREEQQARKSR